MTEPIRNVVRVMHVFAAPAERVFDAWLDPQLASRWLFATPTGTNVRTVIDARPGGRFTVVDRRDGDDVEHTGTWIQLDRPRRLVFDFAVPAHSPETTRVSVSIAARADGGSELDLAHEGVPEEMAEKTADGWRTMLRGLASRLGMSS